MRVELERSGEAVVIQFAFDAVIKDRVKALGARFDWNSKVWRLLWPEVAGALPQLEAWGFEVAPAVRARLEGQHMATQPIAPAEARGVSVGELNRSIAAALAERFSMPIWVRGEAVGLSRSMQKRHLFFELVERDAGTDVVATVSAVMFEQVRDASIRALDRLGLTLEDGMQLCVRGRIDLWVARGTYRLTIDSIDAEASLGELAARKEVVLRTLRAEGIARRNLELPRPALPLRIALLTSAGSDAYHDIITSLRSSGLAFEVMLFDVRVQGLELQNTVLAALSMVARHASRFDLCLIARGGGSRVELGAWDNLEVARAVARMPVPVMVAIGHFQDRSALDELAWSCKTPTEAGDTIVAQVRTWWQRAEDLAAGIAEQARLQLDEAGERLRDAAERVASGTRAAVRIESLRVAESRGRLARAATVELRRQRTRVTTQHARLRAGGRTLTAVREHERLGQASRRLHTAAQRQLLAASAPLAAAPSRAQRAVASAAREERHRLDLAAARVAAVDPARILALGFAIVRHPGRGVVTGIAGLAPGEALRIELREGAAHVTVDHLEPDPKERP